MRKRQKEKEDAYEAQWDNGRGSHHPDYDPYAQGDNVVKASRFTEELYNAIVKNDIRTVYEKISEGADVNFVFGEAYQCRGGYTPLMVASHRGRLECAKALLRAGADPNFTNGMQDLTLFWGIDGGVEMIKLLHEYGALLTIQYGAPNQSANNVRTDYCVDFDQNLLDKFCLQVLILML